MRQCLWSMASLSRVSCNDLSRFLSSSNRSSIKRTLSCVFIKYKYKSDKWQAQHSCDMHYLNHCCFQWKIGKKNSFFCFEKHWGSGHLQMFVELDLLISTLCLWGLVPHFYRLAPLLTAAPQCPTMKLNKNPSQRLPQGESLYPIGLKSAWIEIPYIGTL